MHNPAFRALLAVVGQERGLAKAGPAGQAAMPLLTTDNVKAEGPAMSQSAMMFNVIKSANKTTNLPFNDRKKAFRAEPLSSHSLCKLELVSQSIITMQNCPYQECRSALKPFFPMNEAARSHTTATIYLFINFYLFIVYIIHTYIHTYILLMGAKELSATEENVESPPSHCALNAD